MSQTDMFVKTEPVKAGKVKKSAKGAVKQWPTVQGEFGLGFDAGHRGLQVWLASRMAMNCVEARAVLKGGVR